MFPLIEEHIAKFKCNKVHQGIHKIQNEQQNPDGMN